MVAKKKNELKKEAMNMFKDWNLEDLKDAVAEIAAQFIELGAEVDGVVHVGDAFRKEIRGLVRTLSFALYFHSISNIALTEILIDSGLVSREALRKKISECLEKESFAEYLGLNFLSSLDLESDKIERLEKWLDPMSLEKIKGLH